MSDRSGFSIALAVFAIAILGVFVFAFSAYSRNELLLVRRMLEQKRAEALATSGIEWARAQLQRRRWYAAEHRYWGVHRESEPFGPGSGELKVVCEDMRHPQVRHYARHDAVMLSHVNVYSQGRAGDRTVLVYGRFVMSPMPWLRSDSTDGAPEPDQASTPEGGGPGALASVEVPKMPFQGGFLDARVLEISVTAGQQVGLNDPVARVDIIGMEAPTQLIATAAGRVREVRAQPGQVVPGGAVLLTIEPSDPDAANTVPFTLKAMVRVTRMTEPGLADADIETPAGREAVRERIRELSVEFVANHLRISPGASRAAAGPPAELPERLAPAQLLELVQPGPPAADSATVAGNTFVRDRFLEFVWPCTPEAERRAANDAINFVLDLEPAKPNPLVKRLFDATGTRYTTANPVKSVAGPGAARALLDVTRVGLNDPEFVSRAGIYEKAQWRHSVRWAGRFNAGPGGFDTSTLGNGVVLDGVFYQNPSCTEQAYDRPYVLYTEPGGRGRSVRVGHVLNYYRMFYTEAGAIAPLEPIRLDLDLMDRVINPPPGPTPMGGGAGDFG